MAKVAKFTDKVKKLKRKDVVVFEVDDGTVEFTVVSRSESEIDVIRNKYDNLKPKVPTKRVPVKGGGYKVLNDEDNVEYQQAVNKVLKEQITEMAILFMEEEDRPEGTVEEQIKAMQDVELAGFVPKIFDRGMIISGLRDDNAESYDEEVEEAKN
jgi:hypothetical protein